MAADSAASVRRHARALFAAARIERPPLQLKRKCLGGGKTASAHTLAALPHEFACARNRCLLLVSVTSQIVGKPARFPSLCSARKPNFCYYSTNCSQQVCGKRRSPSSKCVCVCVEAAGPQLNGFALAWRVRAAGRPANKQKGKSEADERAINRCEFYRWAAACARN